MKNTTKQPPREDLAALIASVLTHPDMPEKLYDSLIDGLMGLDQSVKVYHEPEYVRAVLREYADYQQKKKR